MDADLVQYFVVLVPDVESLASVVPSLVELVKTEAIRVLDLVVIQRKVSGRLAVLELEDVESLEGLAEIEGEIGGLLSDHDVELVSLALRPGAAGLVVVTEDRWAQSLSLSVQRAGGRIIAGDRIPASRIEAALAAMRDADPLP